MSTVTIGRSGERDITGLLESYLGQEQLYTRLMSEDSLWLDAGLFESLHHAATEIRSRQNESGELIGCPELTAHRQGWISDEQLAIQAERYRKNTYGQQLLATMFSQ